MNLSTAGLAPIVLFAFNRPIHTKLTLKALSEADWADQSDLYIYIDGPRAQSDNDKILQIMVLAEKVEGFRSVKVIERSENYGLAKNITEAVTEIINQFNRVIVLEDDIVVSKSFLRYMNNALNYYENTHKVWHISAFHENINVNDHDRIYFSRLMRCWGWGTWKDRWQYFHRDVKVIMKSFKPTDIYRFNIDGSENFWYQLQANRIGMINTWAIFWYAIIFLNNGLCLSPVISYTKNIGMDGSGEHCDDDGGKYTITELNQSVLFNPPSLSEDTELIIQLKEFYKQRKISLWLRLMNKFRKIVRKLNRTNHR